MPRPKRAVLLLRDVLREREIAYELYGPGDLNWHAARLAVFVDLCLKFGCPDHALQTKTKRRHYLTTARAAKEAEATAKATGWTVKRVWEHDALNYPESVIDQVVKWIEESKGLTGEQMAEAAATASQDGQSRVGAETWKVFTEVLIDQQERGYFRRRDVYESPRLARFDPKLIREAWRVARHHKMIGYSTHGVRTLPMLQGVAEVLGMNGG